MSSIVFAVLLSVLMFSVKNGLLNKMEQNIVGYYTGYIQVHQKGYWDEKILDNTFDSSEELEDQLLANAGVKAAVPRLESFALAASDEKSKGVAVIGIDPEGEHLATQLKDKLVDGIYLTATSNGAMLTTGVAEYLDLGLGDTLVLLGQGYRGATAVGKYVVQGMIEFASPDLNSTMVYLPLTQSQELYVASDKLTSLVLLVDNPSGAHALAEELRSDIVGDKYEIMSWQELLPDIHQFIEAEKAENIIFQVILYVLIAFGIFGTILMMTLERQYEFGVLVAIGMRRAKLSTVVVMENVMISMLGVVIGMLISIPIVGYFYNFPIRVSGKLQEAYENFGFEPVFYFSIEPIVFYSQTIVVLVISLILSIYPMFKIGFLDPIKAMRA